MEMDKVNILINSQFKDSFPLLNSLSVDDFTIIKLIGKGSYGKVLLVKKKDSLTDDVYAMKILKKKEMIIRNQVIHIKTERKIMEMINHPFIIKLEYAFQNKHKLYLLTKFCPGGELFFHMQRIHRFNEEATRFYTSQIVLALEHLHSKDIIYRDLKPENIVIDLNGYIKLTDFGLAECNVNEFNKAKDFCGTPEYLAPEFFSDSGYSKEIDWWSLGVLIYEMVCGRPPFVAKSRETLFKMIQNPSVYYPNDISEDIVDFLNKIFIANPLLRLGHNGAEEIKNHPFFKPVNWDVIIDKKQRPPFMPRIQNLFDTKYIHQEFLDEEAIDSLRTTDCLNSKEDQFLGNSFDYKKEEL